MEVITEKDESSPRDEEAQLDVLGDVALMTKT